MKYITNILFLAFSLVGHAQTAFYSNDLSKDEIWNLVDDRDKWKKQSKVLEDELKKARAANDVAAITRANRKLYSLRTQLEGVKQLAAAEKRGKGTKFTIRLPLTLAILDGLVVRAGDERFVIPTFAVRESLRPSLSQIHMVSGEPRLVQVRERVLPLVCIRKLFGLNQGGNPIETSTLVVIEDQHRQVALIVDELIGAQEVVVKPLGASMNVTGISGGAILGDGKVGLILDADGVMRIATAATAHLEAA